MLGFTLQPGVGETQIDSNLMDWWSQDPNAAPAGSPSTTTDIGAYIDWISGGSSGGGFFPSPGVPGPTPSGPGGARIAGFDAKTVVTIVGAVFVFAVLLKRGS